MIWKRKKKGNKNKRKMTIRIIRRGTLRRKMEKIKRE